LAIAKNLCDSSGGAAKPSVNLTKMPLAAYTPAHPILLIASHNDSKAASITVRSFPE